MIQGYIGNCWFISAVAALAEFPGRIEKLFLNTKNEQSKFGIYGMNIFTLGMPSTVLVDDWLPVYEAREGKYTTLFGAVSDDNALWGAIIEKVFAKRHGNYEHLVGGLPN